MERRTCSVETPNSFAAFVILTNTGKPPFCWRLPPLLIKSRNRIILKKTDKMATIKIRDADGKTRTLSSSSYKWLYPPYDPEEGFVTQLQKQMRREHGLPTDTVSEELLIRLLDGVDRFARARGI